MSKIFDSYIVEGDSSFEVFFDENGGKHRKKGNKNSFSFEKTVQFNESLKRTRFNAGQILEVIEDYEINTEIRIMMVIK